LLRERLQARGLRSARELWGLRNGAPARTAGLVLIRQRPGSASGVIFATLEDETGTVNIVVWPRLAEAQRRALLGARLLAVSGTIQHESDVLHLVAGRLEDLSHWLGALDAPSRDFH
jgi:error-prone DNA polymerase